MQQHHNVVTCHDGFTLHDPVSYDRKHNEASGENNRDGSSDNLSFNCGVEGETSDAEVTALRDRQAKNFSALLMLSRGVPMLLAGDEVLRTQHGNNNTYSQDNEISWLAQASPVDVVEREHQTAHAAPRYSASAHSVVALEAR